MNCSALPATVVGSQINQANLFIISGPSGAGKTEIVSRILNSVWASQVATLVNYTTRPPAAGEVNGKHYHFVDDAQFKFMIDQGAFAEHASVHGYQYGTAKRAIECALRDNKIVLHIVDVQGAAALRKTYPACKLVFVAPESIEVLAARLAARSRDVPEVNQRRLARAGIEIAHQHEFDHVIVNRDGCLQDAVLALMDIMQTRPGVVHAQVRREAPTRQVFA